MKPTIGATGAFVWILGILLIIAASANWAQEIQNTATGVQLLPQNAVDVLSAAVLVFTVGVIATAGGVYKFSKKHGQSKAQTASFIGLIGGFMLLSGIMSIAGVFLVGIFLIVFGLSLRDVRAKLGTGLAGWLCIASGALFLSIIGNFFAYIVAIPALLLVAKTLSD